ncbi:MAG: hypothetical protein MJ071_08920 [Oscillospiraceae bacterium]|nr:hypothetical protein [Oscillospiraceae bacterium]
MKIDLSLTHLGKARCAMDITDGSERGEYVSQDYILKTLGRPLRSVNLMYCYYPLDETFPVRARDAFRDKEVKFQWDYPYDDYFPYTGGLNGDRSSTVFQQMRDIRRHGQDVTLTLTCDPAVSDAHLIAIAEDLRPFGRMFLRLNHEATGNWFSFNKRASYEEVAAFFVRACGIIHQHAPNVQMIICLDGVKDIHSDKMEKDDEFACTIPAADIWSVDKYMALHWGWPYDTALKDGNTHARHPYHETYALTKKSYRRFLELNQENPKPMVMSEFNADGDVTGPYDQCKMVDGFFRLLKEDEEDWLSGINFYQFRDRGRLGLEIQDPSDAASGMPQPVMQTFKKWIQDPLFLPRISEHAEAAPALPITLRWGGAEDADGIAMLFRLEQQPHFCELVFSDKGNYMIEFLGRWFYKAPEAAFVDLMPAFFEHPLEHACDAAIRIFAPPADGINPEDDLLNCYTLIEALPALRVEYEPVEPDLDE